MQLSTAPLYSTRYGSAYVGDSLALMRELPSSSVNLVLTSPPYALHFKKEYGNKSQSEYVKWFLPFAKEFFRVLRDDGSFVLDIGGSWQPGKPTKLPAPAEWVTVRKIRIKDAVECLWWLSKTPHPKASNQRVLNPYSEDMKRLIKKGYTPKRRPSGHNITHKFGNGNGGSIPSNLLIYGNNDSNGRYLEACKAAGMKAHPARFPIQLPTFFVRFLTEPGDVVLEPFAGSNTTGEACEREKRRWVAFEIEKSYLAASRFRFDREMHPVKLVGNGTKTRGSPQQEMVSLFDFARLPR